MPERKIILGGDDDYFRGPLSTRLEDAGYGVILAARTADVVKTALVESREVAMMILDLHSPRLDAVAALATIATEQPTRPIPVIGVRTPAEDPSFVQSIRQAGIRSFIDRETPFNEILYLIRQLVAPSAAERRKHPRVPSSVPVEFWSEGDSHKSGFVTDISEGGIFIQTLEHIVLGHTLNVRFKLGENGRMVEASGEVVYMSPKMNRKTTLLPGVGVKFREIPESQQEAIQAYVESVLRRMPDLYHKGLIGIDKSTS